ncbi:hypothetical protein EDB83DRAFT_2321631 [Lactarius deliciosus]|nr:hypothetical protein EDB83DRAFT_2321631 [Lactarius deliciosus]
MYALAPHQFSSVVCQTPPLLHLQEPSLLLLPVYSDISPQSSLPLQATTRQATTKQLETHLNNLKYAMDEGSKELETEFKKVHNVNERIDAQLELLRNHLDQAETVASGLSKLKGDIEEGFASLRSGISSHQEQVDRSTQEWQQQITNKKLQSIEVTLTSILSALPTPESNNSQIPDSPLPPLLPTPRSSVGTQHETLESVVSMATALPPLSPAPQSSIETQHETLESVVSMATASESPNQGEGIHDPSDDEFVGDKPQALPLSMRDGGVLPVKQTKKLFKYLYNGYRCCETTISIQEVVQY